MIVPTTGRIVWFYGREGQEQPNAAIVCYVHNARMINVVAFDYDGNAFPYTSVRLLQDGDMIPGVPYATWMPYQKAVASGELPPTLHATS